MQWSIYQYDYAVYTINLSRYSNYYISTAIIPSLLITGLTLLALWIRDLGSRLAMGVTGLLTLVAVQVHTHMMILITLDIHFFD